MWSVIWPLFWGEGGESDRRARVFSLHNSHFLRRNADARAAVRLMQVEGIVDRLFVLKCMLSSNAVRRQPCCYF